MKKTANCIHHTHWDLIWYFTAQDASVQFAYNMKEILEAFDNGTLDCFFLDGQTAPVDEYIQLFPEDQKRIQKYVETGKLVIGPFNSQLDSFITSGESVINNLRLGIKSANKLGGASKVAYLPDSFGHSVDYPKIFNQFGIEDFVITRGVGDEYELGSEFILESNDSSKLLVYTMIAGYGYGCYAFKEGTLFTDDAVDYNKIDIKQLVNRLLSYSTIENEFVFPLGFDQNPMIHNVSEKIDYYNNKQNAIEFVEITWKDFFEKIRKHGKGIKTHRHELISTQYHRVHRSIYSARADVKALQDKCERILTYELQPMMTLLDSLGIEYSHGLLDKAWETLILCQTHSSANLTEETNDYIERETKNALNFVLSHKYYLLKLMSLSLDMEGKSGQPLIVVNTLPYLRDEIVRAKIFTKNEKFSLRIDGHDVDYIVIRSEKKNNDVLRKDPKKIRAEKNYYETDIYFRASNLEGLSYRVYLVDEEKPSPYSLMTPSKYAIENEYYRIYQTETGISVLDKKTKELHEKVVYIEDSGDEGDSFDYSYPSEDWKINDYLESGKAEYVDSSLVKSLTLTGEMSIPMDLKERKKKKLSSLMPYKIKITLEEKSSLIKLSGEFDNKAEQHRVRLIFTGVKGNTHSTAGTQYSIIERKTSSLEQKKWKELNYFEEPSPIFPLLNHVSAVHANETMTVFTRSSKEYEFVNENFKDIGVTIFRSYGALGYPDLNRRPGRPSGLDYMIFETPNCQMKYKNKFELAFSYQKAFNPNETFRMYTEYAKEAIVYQKQDFDKSINPIDYFPTNAFNKKLPFQYKLLSIENGESVFGSIVKSDNSNAYILRVFNCEPKEIELGEIEGEILSEEMYITNLEETIQIELSDKDSKLYPGELRNIRLSK
ncbi:glycoside hydrolase family 38 N-terminal domain-containing protein [Vagococcus elongatus]|uniref:PTS fructose transporter subunit IIA n=1 Tax=Vagococcus elongatus TaxID=180344 RepID=A0A430AI81_9ENTE|nr:glycoside hydrolase family 38 C-terminal domain-containing protein [Vagococcus elongatus]RSU07617.1 PTS fructose transporter subunit IIA [Vagococcus elongatus]